MKSILVNTLWQRLVIVLTLIIPTAACSQEIEISEGRDYTVLTTPQPIQTGDKIEVAEMFWYGCVHCYALEPYLREWKENSMPANAELVEIPADFGNERMKADARAFYTFAALGLVDKLHRPYFDALHGDSKKQFRNAEQLAEWAQTVDAGIDAQQIINTYNSFGVDSKLRFSGEATRNYQIEGVPAIIVDGKYLTSVSRAGGQENLLKVIDALIEKSAAERLGSTAAGS